MSEKLISNSGRSSRNRIQSVDRAIEILKCFDNGQELGVTEISKMLSLPKSTAFGLISTLSMHDILEKNNSTDKYKLGLGLYHLGNKVSFSLREMAFPYLERLVTMYKETANLVTIQGNSVIYLDKVESSLSIGINTLVGGQKPLHCTAVGKSILAFLQENEAKEKIANMELEKYTDLTITTKEQLLSEMKEIRDKGYSEDREEMELGLHCIGAPIFNQYGIPFAAISISGPVSRMTEDVCKEAGATLVRFADEISRNLGYIGK